MNYWGPEALLKIRVKLALQRILVKEGRSIALNSKWGRGKETWDEGTGNCHSSMRFCRVVWDDFVCWSRFCHTPVSCSFSAWQILWLGFPGSVFLPEDISPGYLWAVGMALHYSWLTGRVLAMFWSWACFQCSTSVILLHPYIHPLK